MKIVYSSKFLKSFEKLPNDIQIDFRLGTHKLKGRDEWSFLITYKIRLLIATNIYSTYHYAWND